MPQPWGKDYGKWSRGGKTSDDFSDPPQFEHGEFFRGRPQHRETFKCGAKPKPCGHRHTEDEDGENDGCDMNSVKGTYVCCDCGGTAYSASDQRSRGSSFEAYENPSSSRTSSQDRKEKELEKTLNLTPEFNGFQTKVRELDLDDVDGLPPLDKPTYDKDPEDYVKKLLSIPNDQLREVINGLMKNDSSFKASRS